MNGRLLVVDDDVAMGQMLATHLRKRQFEVTIRTTAAAAFDTLRTGEIDVVITDLNMKGETGLDLCARIVDDRPDVPVVMMTAFGSIETAIGAIRAGAYDFVLKPFEIATLVVAIERALQHRRLRQEVTRLRQVVADSRSFGQLIGNSSPMRELYQLIDRVKDSDASVLVTGESGTGKELIAHALHGRSRRSAGPFVAVNCAAVPETLLESELFGHVRGAFTDAKNNRVGLFVQAHGGTLFLDEIAELPVGLQPKLLRALQERKLRPVGGESEVSFDARIIAATNRDLESEVEDGRFREDLYYRLNVLHFDLPPLRSRGNDVLVLAQHFLERYSAAAGKSIEGISAAAAERLMSYYWPGNVRELQNCVERAVALAQYTELAVEDLPEKIRSHKRNQLVLASDDPDELVTMDEVERRYIQRVLEASGGNKTVAAKILGFDRTTLYRKLERYGLSDGR